MSIWMTAHLLSLPASSLLPCTLHSPEKLGTYFKWLCHSYHVILFKTLLCLLSHQTPSIHCGWWSLMSSNYIFPPHYPCHPLYPSHTVPLLLLEHTKPIPFSGTLSLQFLLLRIFFPQIFTWCPPFLHSDLHSKINSSKRSAFTILATIGPISALLIATP